MTCLITYDISKDRTRTKLADALLEIGMERVQKSVYMGTVKPRLITKVKGRFLQKLEEHDKLFVIRLSQAQVEDMFALGLEIMLPHLLGQINTLIV
jgi:CRISPR-associated endonuclease Cas2